MALGIYPVRSSRPVQVAPGHETAIVDAVRRLSLDCKENIVMLETELRTADPDPDDRCGLLAGRFEVFAITVPACARARLAVSVDLASARAPAMIHGPVAPASACASARRLAERHRDLTNPAWESKS